MLSQRAKGWRWYDWIFVAIIAIVIIGAIRAIAPTSGLSVSLHNGVHALAIGLNWVGNGLVTLASLLNQI